MSKVDDADKIATAVGDNGTMTTIMCKGGKCGRCGAFQFFGPSEMLGVSMCMSHSGMTGWIKPKPTSRWQWPLCSGESQTDPIQVFGLACVLLYEGGIGERGGVGRC